MSMYLRNRVSQTERQLGSRTYYENKTCIQRTKKTKTEENVKDKQYRKIVYIFYTLYWLYSTSVFEQYEIKQQNLILYKRNT